jgi:hypothetical protein
MSGLPPSQPAAATAVRTRAQLRTEAVAAQAAAVAAATASAAAAAQAAVAPAAVLAGAGGAAPDATALIAQLMTQQLQLARAQQAQQLALQTQQASANAEAALAAAEALAQQRRAGAGQAPSFHGTRGGDDLAVNTWLSALELWFGVAHIDASLDAERIEVAAAALRGPAQQWWIATSASDAAAVAAGAPNTASTIGRWAEVVALLRKHYLPQDPARWAMQQIDVLTSGSNTNVLEYTNRFRQLDLIIGQQNEGARVHAYERGLPESYRIKSAESKHATLDAATDAMLARWNAKGVARAHSSSSRHSGAAVKLSHTQAADDSDAENEEREQHSTGTASATSSNSTLVKLLEAMQAQISAMQMQSGKNYGNEEGFSRRGNGGRRDRNQREGASGRPARSRTPGVSEELAKQRLQARVCIKCAEAGHYARDCTNELKTN